MDNKMIATMVVALLVGILIIISVSAIAGWQATASAVGQVAAPAASAVSSGGGMVGGC